MPARISRKIGRTSENSTSDWPRLLRRRREVETALRLVATMACTVASRPCRGACTSLVVSPGGVARWYYNDVTKYPGIGGAMCGTPGSGLDGFRLPGARARLR